MEGLRELHKLENTILELLGIHHCVTVPGLGSFIYRDFSASANHFTLELKPSGNTVFFNNAIQADDGILANALRETLGMTYSEALAYVKQCTDEIRTHLAEKKNLAFGKLGNFFLNAEQQVFFLPSGSLNLSKSSYGLPILKLEELQKAATQMKPEPRLEVVEKPVISIPLAEAEFEEAEVLYHETTEHRSNRGLVWKVAAGLAAVAMAGGMWYFGRQYLGNRKQHNYQAASSDVLQKVEKTEASATDNTTAQEPTQNTESKTSTDKAPAPSKPTISKVDKNNEVNSVEAPEEKPLQPLVSEEAFRSQLDQKKGSYFVLGGMFIVESMAQNECKKWHKIGVNATIIKPENSSLYRIVLGKFTNDKAASDFMQTLPGFHGATVSVRHTTSLK